MGSVTDVPAIDRRSDWMEHCPLRDEESPEYRLLLASVREEIQRAMSDNTASNRALSYSRWTLILLALSVVAQSFIYYVH